MRIVALRLCLLLLAATPAAAGEGRYAHTPGETNPNPLDEAIPLSFDWPVGLSCETTARTERTGFGPERDRTYTVRDRWRVGAHAEGLLLHQELVSVELLSPPGRSLAVDAEGLATLLAAWLPDRVVALDASFRRLDNLEAYRTAVERAWSAEVGKLDGAGLTPGDVPMIGPSLDARKLQAKWSQAWSAELGFWHGRRLPVGATSMAIVVEPAALLPGVPIMWNYTFRIARTLPCVEGGPPDGCVELVYDASPGKADLLRALGASGRAILPAGAVAAELPLTWADPQLKVHAEVVVEPRTLIPHRARLELSLKAEARAGDRSWFVAATERRSAESTCQTP